MNSQPNNLGAFLGGAVLGIPASFVSRAQSRFLLFRHVGWARATAKLALTFEIMSFVLVLFLLMPACGQVYTSAAPQARAIQFIFTNYPAALFVTNNLGTTAPQFGTYQYSAGQSTNNMLVYTNILSSSIWYFEYNDLGWRRVYKPTIWDLGTIFPDVSLGNPFLTTNSSATNQWWNNGSGNPNGGPCNLVVTVTAWVTTTNAAGSWYATNAPSAAASINYEH